MREHGGTAELAFAHLRRECGEAVCGVVVAGGRAQHVCCYTGVHMLGAVMDATPLQACCRVA